MAVICPHCGSENPDIRLFCLNCGEVLPDPSEAGSPAPGQTGAKPDAPKGADSALFPTRQSAQENPEAVFAPEKSGGTAFSAPSVPVLNRQEGDGHGSANTYIPRRDDTMDPDDFFSVKGEVDPLDSPAPSDGEEGEEQSFSMRHLRGIVSGSLLLMTLLIILVWLNTSSAQRMLARIDLSWRAEAYEELGTEAYQAGDYSSAGHYFSKALNRAPDQYRYALYAANSYISIGDAPKAVEALRVCISLNPAQADLYVRLMELQGGYDKLSGSDRALVKKGYEATLDERLNAAKDREETE